MPISIITQSAQPNQLANNSTTSVTITFIGVALKNGVNVIVDFKIAPFPELNFNGNIIVSGSYVFNTTSQTFTKTVTITNNHHPTVASFLNGLIALTATDHSSGEVAHSFGAIIYH